MNQIINYWDKFYSLQESDTYIKFNFENKVYLINKDVNLNNKLNYFSVEISYTDIIGTDFLKNLEKLLKINSFEKIFLRIKPNLDQTLSTKKLINFLNSQNYSTSLIDVMIVDLRKDILELRSKIRKSYKSSINKEEKKIQILFSNNEKNVEKVFIDWKNIYSAAISRGGKKISELNFNFLKEALIKKQCFISMGYEKNEALGGMLFSIYSDYIFYASSVRIPKIEIDKKRSIHHCLMWASIVELKKKYRFLELGAFYKEIDRNDKLNEWSRLEEKFNKFKLGFNPDIIKTIYFYKKIN